MIATIFAIAWMLRLTDHRSPEPRGEGGSGAPLPPTGPVFTPEALLVGLVIVVAGAHVCRAEGLVAAITVAAAVAVALVELLRRRS